MGFFLHTHWRKVRALKLQGVQPSAVDMVNRELFDKILAYKLIAYAVQMEDEAPVQGEC